MSQNRYIVMMYDAYYPGAGMSQIKGVFISELDAEDFIEHYFDKTQNPQGKSYDYVEVYDVWEKKVVAEYELDDDWDNDTQRFVKTEGSDGLL